MDCIAECEALKNKALEQLKSVCDEMSLASFFAEFLAKKGSISSLMSRMREIPASEKAAFGAAVNGARKIVEESYQEKKALIDAQKLNQKLTSEATDISLPGRKNAIGKKNPYYQVIDEVTNIFLTMGYEVAEGRDVETDLFNFELLNVPKDHPSRDMQDTFYVEGEGDLLLRTQTSAAQAHAMLEKNPKGPIKLICPGKAYRRDDDDMTHSHQFAQIEGLVISEDCTFANLLETLTLLLKHLFGEKREVRFRPSFFPFTEPSVEADIQCFECNGKGCSLCKHTGWIEVLGSGMVHPNVLRLNGYDDKKYKGFAFGIGIDRVAMLKYGIDDIKRFYTNDIDFIEQFRKE